MPYVLRSADGSIRAASLDDAMSLLPGWQQVASDAPDYLAFLESALAEANPFRESDINLARVLEDLIEVLIDRDVIRFTDFPEAARKRLLERQALRRKTQLSQILDEDSDLI
jgi:hypothetical protein